MAGLIHNIEKFIMLSHIVHSSEGISGQKTLELIQDSTSEVALL
jgi:hypothetical protein